MLGLGRSVGELEVGDIGRVGLPVLRWGVCPESGPPPDRNTEAPVAGAAPGPGRGGVVDAGGDDGGSAAVIGATGGCGPATPPAVAAAAAAGTSTEGDSAGIDIDAVVATGAGVGEGEAIGWAASATGVAAGPGPGRWVVGAVGLIGGVSGEIGRGEDGCWADAGGGAAAVAGAPFTNCLIWSTVPGSKLARALSLTSSPHF